MVASSWTFCTALTGMLPFFQTSARSPFTIHKLPLPKMLSSHRSSSSNPSPALAQTVTRSLSKRKVGWNLLLFSDPWGSTSLDTFGIAGYCWGSSAYSPFSVFTPSFWYFETHAHPFFVLQFLFFFFNLFKKKVSD